MQKHILRGVALLMLILAGHANAQNSLSDMTTGQSVDQQGFKVTFMIYSGLPNPTMIVRDRGQIEKINQMYADSFASNRQAGISGETPPVLGYNGIMIEPLAGSDEKASAAESGTEILVNRGRIKARPPATLSQARTATGAQTESTAGVAEPAEEAVSYDPDKNLESFLLRLAREQGVLDSQTAGVVEEGIAR